MDNFEFDLLPSISYYESSYDVLDENVKNKSTTLAINLGCNKYFGLNKIKPYVGCGLQGGIRRSENDHIGIDENLNVIKTPINYKDFFYSGKFVMGLAFFIRESISLDLLLNYNYLYYKNKPSIEGLATENQKTHSINFGTRINVFIK